MKMMASKQIQSSTGTNSILNCIKMLHDRPLFRTHPHPHHMSQWKVQVSLEKELNHRYKFKLFVV